MSEFSDLTGRRDWSTPLPWTGKPYVKTYWDWLRCCWRTDVCILLGAREEPPGKPWSERKENAGKGQVPDRERKDLSPQGHRSETFAGPGAKAKQQARTDTIRARIRDLLRSRKTATFAEIAAALPDVNSRSVAATIHHDKMITQVGGRGGSGRVAKDADKARYSLVESAVEHE